MTVKEFNEKWNDHIEEGHYGLAIDYLPIIEYLDKEFEDEVKVNPDFKFSQVKIKFNFSRVYTNSDKSTIWEQEIDKLLKR